MDQESGLELKSHLSVIITNKMRNTRSSKRKVAIRKEVQPKAESRKKKPTTRSKAGARTLEKKGTKNASSKLARANRYFKMMEERIRAKKSTV